MIPTSAGFDLDLYLGTKFFGFHVRDNIRCLLAPSTHPERFEFSGKVFGKDFLGLPYFSSRIEHAWFLIELLTSENGPYQYSFLLKRWSNKLKWGYVAEFGASLLFLQEEGDRFKVSSWAQTAPLAISRAASQI